MQDNEKAEAVNALKLDNLIDDVAEIKQSLKELTFAVNRLAIIEERQANTADSLGRAFKELEKHDTRIKELELAEPIQKQSSDLVQNVVRMVIAAFVGAVLTLAVAKQPGIIQTPSASIKQN